MTAKDYFGKLKTGLDRISEKDIEKVVDVLFEAWKNEKQVFILGNGGSAATALHFACDLGKNTIKEINSNSKRFRVIPLVDSIAMLTAYANDLGYEEVFSQQLANLVKEGDVVVAISASGNSANVLKAAETAKKAKATTIGFTGFDGGKLKSIVDYSITFDEPHYGRVEDSHLILEHIITDALRERISKVEGK